MESAPVIELGSNASSGARAYQHDRVLTYATPDASLALGAVFDGHGPDEAGHLVSEHCRCSLLPKLASERVWRSLAAADAKGLRAAITSSISQLEAESVSINTTERAYAGSTACVALASSHIIAVANVGDSRAVLASRRGTELYTTDLSRDHVPNRADEKVRIVAAGGWVARGSLNGYISMSRALGDADLKIHRNRTAFKGKPSGRSFTDKLFTAEPEFSFVSRSPEQRFVIVATDGVWGTVSSKSAVRIVDSSLRGGADANKAAAALVRRALSAGSTDNIAVSVLLLDRASAPEYASKWRRLKPQKVSLGVRRRLRRGNADDDVSIHGAHAFRE